MLFLSQQVWAAGPSKNNTVLEHSCNSSFICNSWSTQPVCIFSNRLREKILNALQGNEIGMIMDPTKFSGNYKMGSIQGNMIFEATSYLPKEVMLEMTLKAFGYDVDLMEVQ